MFFTLRIFYRYWLILARSIHKFTVKIIWYEGGYSILLPQTENEGFSDPPERIMVLWLNRFSLEDFRWYFPNPQCQIVRGLHVTPTPGGQSSEFGKNGWKMLISLQNMSFLSQKHDFLLQKLNFLRIWVSYSKSLLRMKQT